MSTVHREGRFRVVIHSNEPRGEPPHVHVYQGKDEVKIWLGGENSGPSIERARGMASYDQADALEVVRDNVASLRKAWDDRR